MWSWFFFSLIFSIPRTFSYVEHEVSVAWIRMPELRRTTRQSHWWHLIQFLIPVFMEECMYWGDTRLEWKQFYMSLATVALCWLPLSTSHVRVFFHMDLVCYSTILQPITIKAREARQRSDWGKDNTCFRRIWNMCSCMRSWFTLMWIKWRCCTVSLWIGK